MRVAMYLGLTVEQRSHYSSDCAIEEDEKDGETRLVVRSELRAERRNFLIAHEVAHVYWAQEEHHQGDPTLGERLEYFCNKFASLLLIPHQWFREDAIACDYDLLRLKDIYSTASNELIARRLASLRPFIVTIYDDDGRGNKRVTDKFTANDRRPKSLRSAEKMLVDKISSRGEVVVEGGTIRDRGQFIPVRLKGYPIFEGDWKRIILFTEPTEYTDFEPDEFTDDIYPFPEY